LSGFYWDPLAVRICGEAGEGATLDLRVGGKCGVSSGMPVDLRATVRRIVTGAHQPFGDASMPMGTAVWLSGEAGIDIVLTSKRTQTFHPDGFSQLGIDPAGYRGIVVKSIQHFYAGFAPIAARIAYVAAEGAIPPDFAEIPFTQFKAPFWPR